MPLLFQLRCELLAKVSKIISPDVPGIIFQLVFPHTPMDLEDFAHN